MQQVGIIGFGRFGEVLAKILSSDFEVVSCDIDASTMQDVLACKHIFIAVPISQFETVIKNIAPSLTPGTTIIDVCSVKVHPVNVMQKYLPEKIGFIATHPMFGPDSIDDPSAKKIMMHPSRDVHKQFERWRDYFADRQFSVIEMTPDEHDRQAAMSQGLTHFIGRVLADAGVKSTDIDTLGFTRLLQVMDQTCHDSWELFRDLQNYNPYSPQMSKSLSDAITNIQSRLHQ